MESIDQELARLRRENVALSERLARISNEDRHRLEAAIGAAVSDFMRAAHMSGAASADGDDQSAAPAGDPTWHSGPCGLDPTDRDQMPIDALLAALDKRVAERSGAWEADQPEGDFREVMPLWLEARAAIMLRQMCKRFRDLQGAHNDQVDDVLGMRSQIANCKALIEGHDEQVVAATARHDALEADLAKAREHIKRIQMINDQLLRMNAELGRMGLRDSTELTLLRKAGLRLVAEASR